MKLKRNADQQLLECDSTNEPHKPFRYRKLKQKQKKKSQNTVFFNIFQMEDAESFEE